MTSSDKMCVSLAYLLLLTLLALPLLNSVIACAHAPKRTAIEMLDQKAEERPPFNLMSATMEMATLERSSVSTPELAPSDEHARVREVFGPCGSGVRPYLYSGSQPAVGTIWRAEFDFYGLPRPDGIYDVKGAWIVLSLEPPLPKGSAAHVFPNGCELLWNLDSPAVFVWGFTGMESFRDQLFERGENRRFVVLQVVIGSSPAIIGQRAWMQAIVADETEIKFSQLDEIIFGTYLQPPPIR